MRLSAYYTEFSFFFLHVACLKGLTCDSNPAYFMLLFMFRLHCMGCSTVGNRTPHFSPVAFQTWPAVTGRRWSHMQCSNVLRWAKAHVETNEEPIEFLVVKVAKNSSARNRPLSSQTYRVYTIQFLHIQTLAIGDNDHADLHKQKHCNHRWISHFVRQIDMHIDSFTRTFNLPHLR